MLRNQKGSKGQRPKSPQQESVEVKDKTHKKSNTKKTRKKSKPRKTNKTIKIIRGDINSKERRKNHRAAMIWEVIHQRIRPIVHVHLKTPLVNILPLHTALHLVTNLHTERRSEHPGAIYAKKRNAM
mmetsp:Transcript_14789/g.22578  ORF Transcript_14789/g.22578 Transcript_14789/m.22578 type:complete len:127 (-) Transcript_14789:4637-5017(-)